MHEKPDPAFTFRRVVAGRRVESVKNGTQDNLLLHFTAIAVKCKSKRSLMSVVFYDRFLMHKTLRGIFVLPKILISVNVSGTILL